LLNKQFKIVVAHDDHLGIGKENKLPWQLKSDLNFFRKLTTKASSAHVMNAVIMGRRTWESIPVEVRPLIGRYNFVLSKNTEPDLPKSVIVCRNFQEAFSSLNNLAVETSFLIGGAEIFEEAIKRRLCDAIYATEIQGNFHCDRFFPSYRQDFDLIEQSSWQEENHFNFRFNLYMRKPDS
jgi:dihydrofolate reductase / thymidylate synthase